MRVDPYWSRPFAWKVVATVSLLAFAGVGVTRGAESAIQSPGPDAAARDVGPAPAPPKPKPPPSPPPTYPPARMWHAMTSNGSSSGSAVCAPGESRVYMFGGANGASYHDDLWYYCEGSGWQAAPIGRSKPGRRAHVGLSCGGGRCVAANGILNLSPLEETWVYAESQGAWSKLNCRKSICPSARWGATTAYDPGREIHVLFGGEVGNTLLGDTLTFDGARWTAPSPATPPVPRRSAAATYVPSHAGVTVDRVVLFGGQNANGVMCDLSGWNGSNWQPILSETAGPCLHGHGMAWVNDAEAGGPALLVTGGFVDRDDTPNTDIWYFRFSSANVGHWVFGLPLSCDTEPIDPGAKMGLDVPSQKKVFFGGTVGGPQSGIASDKTVVCE